MELTIIRIWQERLGKNVELVFIGADSKKEGFNPKTNEMVLVDRRELFTDFELPMREPPIKLSITRIIKRQ